MIIMYNENMFILSTIMLLVGLCSVNCVTVIDLFGSKIPNNFSLATVLRTKELNENICLTANANITSMNCSVYYIHNHKAGNSTALVDVMLIGMCVLIL